MIQVALPKYKYPKHTIEAIAPNDKNALNTKPL